MIGRELVWLCGRDSELLVVTSEHHRRTGLLPRTDLTISTHEVTIASYMLRGPAVQCRRFHFPFLCDFRPL